MKIDLIRKTVTFSVMLTLGCGVMVAQAITTAEANSPVFKDKKSHMYQPICWRMQMLGEKLNLTDEQKTSIKTIFAADANQIKAIRESNSLSLPNLF
jgi:hypothetical protein